MENTIGEERAFNNIVTEKQLQYILAKIAQPGSQIVGYHVRPASEQGLAGFLGEHLKMVLSIEENNLVRKIHLFIKIVPLGNKPKADFINEKLFFKRESFMYGLIDEIEDLDSQNPWSTKALFHNDDIIIQPDLFVQGYRSYPGGKYFDKEHVLVTLSSLARFHAAFANYFTVKSKNNSYNFLDTYGHIVEEPCFCESPWLRAAAKLAKNLLEEFSVNFKKYPADLEEKIWELFIEATNSLRESEDTLNVVIHKDLWSNNILFQYEGDAPKNAVLVDFQLIRFAPPVFDVISFLYLNTDRNFRNLYEDKVLRHYFSIFWQNLDELTKLRMKDLNYDQGKLFDLCKKARLFGIVESISIFPYILMDPLTAQKTFDNPDTYTEYLDVDRTVPVIAYAKENNHYKDRQVEICEEFVERYVLQNI